MAGPVWVTEINSLRRHNMSNLEVDRIGYLSGNLLVGAFYNLQPFGRLLNR